MTEMCQQVYKCQTERPTNLKTIRPYLLLFIAALVLGGVAGAYMGERKTNSLRNLVDVTVASVYALPIDGGDTLYFSPDRLFPYDTVRQNRVFDYTADSATVVRHLHGFCVGRSGQVQVVAPSADETLHGAALRHLVAQACRHYDTLAVHYRSQVAELDYYARTHSAIDAGYNEVMAYAQVHRSHARHADSTCILLRRADAMLRHTTRRCEARLRLHFSVNGANVSLHSQRGPLTLLTPADIRGAIARNHYTGHDILALCRPPREQHYRDTARRLFTFYPAVWADLMPPILFGGCVRGSASDSADFYGLCLSPDGSVYHGMFDAQFRRHGTGFAVDNHLVKYGVWDNDNFRGEQMLYNDQRIYGIDISRYQHELSRPVVRRTTTVGKNGRRVTRTIRTNRVGIDWSNLRITHLGSKAQSQAVGSVDYPVSFVFIKCTQGTSIRSNYYLDDLRAARRHGIPSAPYHFFSHKAGGAAQAAWFVKHAHLAETTLPPMLDVEPTTSQIAAMGGVDGMFREILRWMNAVEVVAARPPILYVSQSFVNKYMPQAPPELLRYDVWIARYGEYRPYVKLLLWQLTPFGRVRGIEGDVDINVFNGSRDHFDRWCGRAVDDIAAP